MYLWACKNKFRKSKSARLIFPINFKEMDNDRKMPVPKKILLTIFDCVPFNAKTPQPIAGKYTQ